MSTRQNEIALGKETSLFVNKGSTEAPNWVLVGCGTSKDYGLSNNLLEANCDSGKIVVPDGEDATYDLNFTGFVFEYASGNQATNVSAREFETWATPPLAAKEYRLARPHEGDTVRTFTAYIATFREASNNGEISTYTIAFRFRTKPTNTTVAPGGGGGGGGGS